MQPVNTQHQNIQYLISANYQRMMAFEQAAFVCDESALKSFFAARADESEANVNELCACLNISTAEAETYAAQQRGIAEKVAALYTGRKNTVKILQSAQLLEKTILGWYKSTIKEIAALPKEMAHIVANQYKALGEAEMQLQYL